MKWNFKNDNQPITTQCRIFTHLRYIAVENIVRKGEIACNNKFLLFSQCFVPYMAFISPSLTTSNFSFFSQCFAPYMAFISPFLTTSNFSFFSQCFVLCMTLIFHSKCTLKCRP